MRQLLPYLGSQKQVRQVDQTWLPRCKVALLGAVPCICSAPPAEKREKLVQSDRIPVTTRGTHTHASPKGGLWTIPESLKLNQSAIRRVQFSCLRLSPSIRRTSSIGADKVERPETSSSVKVATWQLVERPGAPSSNPEKEREERKVFPATTQASKDTPKEGEGFSAMTKASRDTQGG